MNKEEIKKWFWNKFNFCYAVKNEDFKESIILIYNKKFIRQKKLCRITGEELKYPKNVKGKCLFYLDFQNNNFECSYEYIWSFLEKNYSSNYINIRNLIKEILKKYDKLYNFNPYYFYNIIHIKLDEKYKLYDIIF